MGRFYPMKKSYFKLFLGLVLVLILVSLINLRTGSVWIPWHDFTRVISGQLSDSGYHTIVWQYRMPKLLVAAMAGAGLGLAGLLLQTMFRNPIVGPYVLGISSGSGLAVALVMMSGLAYFSGIHSAYILSLAAIAGSFLVLAFNLFLFEQLRKTEILLIAGLMIGAFSGAVLSILSVYAPAEQLQRYFFWTMGNLTVSRPVFLWILGLGVPLLFIISASKIKYLNLLLLGDDYVRASGVRLDRLRWFIILISGILTGLITAVTGPLAFVGLIIPHITRMIFRTQMLQYLIPGVFLTGATFMIAADVISQLPGRAGVLPVNSITALLGAPLVIHLLLRNSR